MFKHPDLGAHIVQLRKSKEYFKNIIEEKSSSDQYKSTPQIVSLIRTWQMQFVTGECGTVRFRAHVKMVL